MRFILQLLPRQLLAPPPSPFSLPLLSQNLAIQLVEEGENALQDQRLVPLGRQDQQLVHQRGQLGEAQGLHRPGDEWGSMVRTTGVVTTKMESP